MGFWTPNNYFVLFCGMHGLSDLLGLMSLLGLIHSRYELLVGWMLYNEAANFAHDKYIYLSIYKYKFIKPTTSIITQKLFSKSWFYSCCIARSIAIREVVQKSGYFS